MAIVVQKYGGTSVAGPDRIKAVARRIAKTAAEGHGLVAVVSAMGKATDDLVKLANEVSEVPHAREMDMLLSAGERVSMALLSMALNDMGYEAVSFTGSQAGIMTDTSHTKARIVDIQAHRVEEALSDGKIAIVAGFQGMSTDRDITTLGRGGSDTTAVAMAAALNADVCEIYTDVAGVFTADPRLVPGAQKIDEITYEEMLEMAASGAGVLALRSVEFARTHNVVIHCRSSFTEEPGTMVKEEVEDVEKALVTAVAHDTSEAMIRVDGVPDRPGIAARIFSDIAGEHINVDMIVQNVSHDGKTDLTFTMPKEDLVRSGDAVRAIIADIGAQGFEADSDIAKLSLIGAGMKTDPGVAAAMFSALAEEGINIEMISTSSIRISCVVHAMDINRAVRVIHQRFGLEGQPALADSGTSG